MSFTSQNLLDMAEALASGVELVSTIDHVLPSPIRFTKKADFFNAVDAQDTKTEIETTLVRAARIRYLNFELLGEEDDLRDIENPIVAINFECTIFHEAKQERLDQDGTPDDFEKRIRKSNQEHITSIFGVVGEFQGMNSIPALSSFPSAETVTPIQSDSTEEYVECDFITGLIGDQTKLELQIRVQLPC